MNKIWAEIIAGVIPHKHTRNRWRGILRYGVINVWKLKRLIKNNRSTPEHYLAVCAIAKNEGPYFKEWIEWHRKQGVEKFYIYDNESTDHTKQILQPYIHSGIVEYSFFPGRRRQLAAYDDCFERHRFDARWIAVIDLDEFIVPQKDGSIPQFLHRMEGYAAVEVNWLVYGSSGKRLKTDGDVMQRFRKHSLPGHQLNTHVKSIVDPRQVCCMIGCHEAARISGKAVDPNGNVIKTHFGDREPQQDVIRINHYAIKSYEEFQSKRARGRARTNALRDDSYFYLYDLNDIEDTVPTHATQVVATDNTPKREVVVAMTSFPQAIPFAVKAIRSILNGSVLPDKMVLYLTFSQFGVAGLPEELQKLAESHPIFEIRNYDRDIGSYRKLVPALSDFPDAIIVTVDDDVWYHRHMLRDLLNLHSQIPHAVLAHRAKRIAPGKPYRKWKKYRWYDFVFKRIHWDLATLQTGVGGVLYPPHSLRTDMLDVEMFTKVAPSCDDIWFWAAAVRNGFPVLPVPFGRNKPRGLHKPKELSLKTINFKNAIDRNASAFHAVVRQFPDIREILNKNS